MANADYRIEAEVSTSNAVKNLRAMRGAASELTSTLRELNRVTAAGEKDLNSYARSVTALLAEQRRAADVQVKLAEARLREAKASGVQQDMNNRIAESRQRQGLIEARTATQTAQAERTRNGIVNDSLRTQSAVEAQSVRNTIAQERLSQATERHGIATRRAAQNQLELTDNLSNTRYLLYDVGATYRTLALGLEAIPVATGVVAAAYQKDFAQVIRVTQGTQIANDQLRQAMKEMSTEIPTSFGDLSKIATLGAQVGIDDTKGLEALTDTVARFTASVDGVPIETATLAFGRMKDSFAGIDQTDAPGYFNKLGSAMAVVGARTAATDSEIVSMLNQIGPLGAEAGFTSAQIIGLSGALASVRVQPELARGTLTRIFANLNRDADQGAKGMSDWAKVMQISGEEALNMWKKNPDEFWTRFIGRLNEAHQSGGSLTAMFDQVGIKASRDVSALTKLAVGYDVLTKSNEAANTAFNDGTALNEMSKPVFETVAARVEILANAIKNMADSFGSGGLAPLAMFVDGLTNVVKWATALADSAPGIKIAVTALMGLSAVAGIMLGIKAVQAFVLAGMVSLQQTMGSAARTTLNTSGLMRQFAVTMLMAKGASEQQANSILRNASAIRALGIATTTTNAAIRSGQAGSLVMANNMTSGATAASRLGTGLRSAGNAALGLVGGLPGLITLIGVGLVGALISAEQQANDAGKAIAEAFAQGQTEGIREIANQLNNNKVNVGNSGLGIIGNLDKSFTQVATELKLPIDRIISAISKGREGVKAEFDQMQADVASARGFKSWKELAASLNPEDMGVVTQFGILRTEADKLADKFKQNESNANATGSALEKLGVKTAGASGEITDATDSVDDLDKALKGLNDTVFGTINKEAQLGDALAKMGEGLQKSGSFGNDEAGRANLKNLQDSLTAAREYYKVLLDTKQITAQQAAQGYGSFVDELLGNITAKGGDLGGVADLAHQTVDVFRTTIHGDAASNPIALPVRADGIPAQVDAQNITRDVQNFIAANNPTMAVFANTTPAQAGVLQLAQDVSTITGIPYQVVLDALTDPANSRAKEMQEYIVQIVNGTYQAAINADTTAAIANVQNFSLYAQSELAKVQSQLMQIAATKSGFFKTAALSSLNYNFDSGSFVSAPTPQVAAAPKQVAATPTAGAAPSAGLPASLNGASGALGNLNQGYDDAAAKAEKAGEKGKKAGKDTENAWKDAANGIDQATSAADDFASRLKQGLDRAFERQYGLQIATDEYYKQLNAINKKREDEVKQVDDLLQKVRELKAERDLDLVDAAKARTEQAISIKYGEGARAADYGAQAAKAEEAAASKQKDIEASQKQAAEIQAGIGQLNGYSDAAIANREALRSLEQKQLDMVVAYAKTGASIDEVRNYAAGLNAQFQSDVGQIGFNQTAVQNLTGDLGRYIDVINAIPYVKPTEIKADTGTETTGATGAVNAFKTAADEATKDRTMTVTVNAQKGIGEAWELITMADGSTERVNRGQSGNIFGPSGYMFRGGIAEGYPTGGIVPGRAPSNPRKDNMLALVDGKRPIGIRSGEGIVTQQATQHYGGAQFIDALNKMRLPRFAMGGVPGGGSGSGGPTAFTLDANSIAQIATAVASMNIEVPVSVDGREIARAASNANRTNNRNGARR